MFVFLVYWNHELYRLFGVDSDWYLSLKLFTYVNQCACVTLLSYSILRLKPYAIHSNDRRWSAFCETVQAEIFILNWAHLNNCQDFHNLKAVIRRIRKQKKIYLRNNTSYLLINVSFYKFRFIVRLFVISGKSVILIGYNVIMWYS